MSFEYKITIFDGHRTCSYEEWLGKSQMTREEASRKIRLACPSFDGRSRANFIRGLEVLGLIKFEEEKIKSIDDCLTPCFGSFAGRDAVKKALDDAGYKIVRK